jgi:hypothetical protein
MFMVSQRDLIQRRRIWHPFPDQNSFLIHFTSCEHEKLPVVSKYVRARSHTAGFFFQTIQTEPLRTFVCSISQTDYNGSLPQSLVTSMTAKAPKDWVINLTKGLQAMKNKNSA